MPNATITISWFTRRWQQHAYQSTLNKLLMLYLQAHVEEIEGQCKAVSAQLGALQASTGAPSVASA